MAIFGTGLLAACTILGVMLGDLLGKAIGVKANVGGVGIAMLMLLGARIFLVRRGLLSPGVKLGVEFWGALYIPIVVAMAAQQNVVAALKGGPVVVVAGALTVLLCFACVGIIGRFAGRSETMDEVEAKSAVAREAARVASGQPV